MTIKEKAERAAAGATLDGLLKYVDKNPQENMVKLLDISEKLLGGTFPKHYIDAMREGIIKGEHERLSDAFLNRHQPSKRSDVIPPVGEHLCLSHANFLLLVNYSIRREETKPCAFSGLFLRHFPVMSSPLHVSYNGEEKEKRERGDFAYEDNSAYACIRSVVQGI